jgi:hypothetical protein
MVDDVRFGSRKLALGFIVLIFFAMTATAGFLARRHLVMGRGDRRGAFRVSMAVFVLGGASWALGADHAGDLASEVGLVVRGQGGVLFVASLLWLFYLALEPYVRRFWPQALISWARLLGGSLRDPLVGRDVLVGIAWGGVLASGLTLHAVLAASLGRPGPHLALGDLGTLLDLRFVFGGLLGIVVASLATGMACVLLFLLLKLLLRRDLLAALALALVAIGLQMLAYPAGSLWVNTVMTLVIGGALFLLLRRFGLLAVVAGFFFSNLLREFPLTLDVTSWASGPSIVVGLTATALAATAFRIALGDRLRLAPAVPHERVP